MSKEAKSRETRLLTPAQLLRWVEDRSGVMRLNTDLDVVPGGYMAALAPMLVAWPATEVREHGATVVVRNVNYGGNPFERKTVLHSLRLELEAVESAEFILVPSREFGRHGPVHHVQLRFIFQEGREPELLSLLGPDTGTDAKVPDIVLSWESWRSPDTEYSLLGGLDERAYGLSLRAFVGAQRYLEESIRGRKWYASPLRMPGGQRGAQELLGVALAIGDGVARNTLGKLLAAGEQSWLGNAPVGESAETGERWRELKGLLPRTVEIEDRLPEMEDDETTYQALVRSCGTLSRYLVLLAAERMVEKGLAGDFDASKLPPAALGDPQPWMKKAASTDLLGVFMHAPAALRFLIANPESVPSHLPEALDEAGLVERRRGKRIEIVYARDETRPYGSTGIRRPG